jgi:hypothetical protein
MLELGSEAAALHRQAGGEAVFLDGLVTVGALAREQGRGAIAAGLDPSKVREAASPEAAGELAAGHLRPGDVVLVKASRGMHFENALTSLRRELGGGLVLYHLLYPLHEFFAPQRFPAHHLPVRLRGGDRAPRLLPLRPLLRRLREFKIRQIIRREAPDPSPSRAPHHGRLLIVAAIAGPTPRASLSNDTFSSRWRSR